MKTVQRTLEGLDHCTGWANCYECPYYGAEDSRSCRNELMEDVDAHISELTNSINELENRLHNRELALDYVRQVDPALWGAMQDEFVFMTDYVPEAHYER